MLNPCIFLIAAAGICHALITLLIHHYGWRRENFKKEKIPAVFGLYIVSYGVFGAVLGRYTPFGSDPAANLYLITILGFGLLGLLDDLFGSRDVGGFRGHFKKLLLEGRLTTGALKAIGGGLLAVYLAYRTSNGAFGLWALDFCIIALAANTINLLDLRPGRAIFVFLLSMIAASLPAWGSVSAPVPVLVVILAAIGVAFYDCRGKAMLGDVGSNTLGAVLGLTLALDSPMFGKIAFTFVFLVINVYSERRSISKLIESNRALAFIDSKLGVR